MTFSEFYHSVLEKIWSLFDLPVLNLGITYKDVFLGFMGLSVAMFALRSLPSITGASVSRFSRFSSRLNKSYTRKGE